MFINLNFSLEFAKVNMKQNKAKANYYANICFLKKFLPSNSYTLYYTCIIGEYFSRTTEFLNTKK